MPRYGSIGNAKISMGKPWAKTHGWIKAVGPEHSNPTMSSICNLQLVNTL